MKKKIIILMIGLLLIGGNVFAGGNLKVTGKLAVGIDISQYAIDVYAKDNDPNGVYGMRAEVETTQPLSYATGGAFKVTASASGYTNPLVGLAGNVVHSGSGDFGNDVGIKGNVVFDSPTPGSSSGNTTGLKGAITFRADNQRDFVFSDLVAVETQIVDSGSVGQITGTNLTGFRIQSPNSLLNGFTNVIGLHLAKQQYGISSNIGIWLEGEDAGSDIVFGSGQEARIYSSGGEIFVEDGASNVTQISPHDPETGEWVYYSKNTRTGIVKKVNMEKLIKAVEKLTGEKFMIETMMDDR